MTNKLTKRQLTALQEFGFSVLHDVVYVGDFGNEWDITGQLTKFADFLTKKDPNPQLKGEIDADVALTFFDMPETVQEGVAMGWNECLKEQNRNKQGIIKQELGWCLEKNINGVLHYAYIHEVTKDVAMPGWTSDNLKALRLSRKEDAEAIAKFITADRVAEHMWIG